MTKEEVLQLASLARIRLSNDEIEVFQRDFDAILGYVDAVREIAAEETPRQVGPVGNVLRDDVETHEPGKYTDALLAAAPERDGAYVKVKKILEQNDAAG
jgi:aspartyl-tRNA(Asn)/glutamyl-tRNA(Gln) amidotransferase subunit C